MAWSFLHEIGRKMIHISILFVLLIHYLIESRYPKKGFALLFLVFLLILFIVLEFMRLELGWKVPVFSAFIRPKEQNRMFGAVYFISATIISLAVFEYKIALAALLMTTFGDMAAALVGKKYGTSLIYRNKTWAGFWSEIVTNLFVGFIVLKDITGSVFIFASMAFVATIVETVVDELDDNLLIPLFSGFVGQVIYLSLF